MTRGGPGINGPPLEPLRAIARRLAGAGVEFALGGSGLLCALGLARDARDWDLTTDAALEEVLPLFPGTARGLAGPSGIHEDHKLRLEDGTVELIVRMAIRSPAGICRIPTIAAGRWDGIPTGSPEAWAVAYALMERPEKAELLFGLLGRTGGDRDAVARLLREPLPPELAARLGQLQR